MTQQLLVAFRPSLLRRTRIFLESPILLTGLLALTAWNVTRSEALGQARQAYARGELTTCLRYSLDHLERRPWSREAALLEPARFCRRGRVLLRARRRARPERLTNPRLRPSTG